MDESRKNEFVSVVVYVHNNAGIIERFLKFLCDIFMPMFEKFEIICVDDNSDDDSSGVIRSFANQIAKIPITVIRMGYYHGQEGSINAGVDLAIGDFIYEFDTVYVDYDPAFIINAYLSCIGGGDIVCVGKSSAPFQAKIFYKFFNRYSRSEHNIGSETFRLLSRRAVNRINSISKTIPYRKAVYSNCGLKSNKLTYQSSQHSEKRTDYCRNNRIETAVSSLILFTNIGYKASIGLSVTLMMLTVICVIYVILFYLANQTVPGYTTTMLLISGCFFGLFLIQAVIIKYLSILIDLVFKKQKYIIETIEKM